MLNQIPRALARQRVEHGTDDVQEGKPVDLEEYIRRGWITEDKAQSKMNLLLGALATCVWLRDVQGVRAYIRQLTELNGAGVMGKINILLRVAQKLVQRIRRNPYKRFTIPS
jgi:hypothetical protein